MNSVIDKIKSGSKSIKDADFLFSIFGNYIREVIDQKSPIVLFGAGSAGVHLANALKIHNVPITCFCDNNSKIVGGTVAGYPVISFEELMANFSGSLIVISVSNSIAHEIKTQLIRNGFLQDKILIPKADMLLYYTNVSNIYWPQEDLIKFETELQETFDILADSKSKELFVNRIALLTNGFDYNSYCKFIDTYGDLLTERRADYFIAPTYDENFFYFNSSIFPLRNNEVFANIGALIGDCALEFAKTCESKGLDYKEIINFEPDPNNYALLTENMSHLPNVRSFPFGLWSSIARLAFSNLDQPHNGIPGKLETDGNMEVDVTTLDELISDSGISFIKMDIEGAELEALKGAANTIKRYKPKLAISIYHKRNDIFEIPLFIHQLYPGYKLYLRHHSSTFCETVLYAMP